MTSALLQVRDLASERDDRLLFEELSFSLSSGELLQIAGANGSGKTTLLRILAGLSSRYRGQLWWRGEALPAARHRFRAETLYLGHGAGNKAVLTPLENLRWSCALRGQRVEQSSMLAALERVGLAGFEEQPCYSLSAGQQRRAGLARLFCQPAGLWILDEPFTAIDQRGVAEIEQWLAHFCAEGGAVLLTTHHRLKVTLSHSVINLGAR